MPIRRFPSLSLLLPSAVAALLLAGAAAAQTSADANYFAYIAAESDDTVDLVRFGPDGGELVRRIPVGILPNEIEGPHGVRVSPDGRHWYVSIAHGMPYGTIHKFEDRGPISKSRTRRSGCSRRRWTSAPRPGSCSS